MIRLFITYRDNSSKTVDVSIDTNMLTLRGMYSHPRVKSMEILEVKPWADPT